MFGRGVRSVATPLRAGRGGGWGTGRGLTTGAEDFNASGFCPSGSAVTSTLRVVGGSRGLTFLLDKTRTCDDGSGAKAVHLDAPTPYGTPGATTAGGR